MKASLKLRDGQKPLVRARVPVNFLGIPLFSAISLGSPEELALHLGSCVEAGPLFKVTYKPNDLHSPFSVLLKSGIGVWGSPAGAALAMAAEFNLSGKLSPSFMLRVKPRVGDFSLRKDTGYWNAGVLRADCRPAKEEPELVLVQRDAWPPEAVSGEVEESKPRERDLGSGVGTVYTGLLQDAGRGRSSIAVRRCEMGVVNGRNGYMGNSGSVHAQLKSTTASPAGAEGGGNYGPSTVERARSFGSVVSHLDGARSVTGESNHVQKPGDGSSGSEASEDSCVFVNGFEEKDSPLEVSGTRREGLVNSVGGALPRRRRFKTSSLASTMCDAWCLRAHSSLPLGKQAVANIRWRVKVPTELFEGSFSLAKLPVLVMDKITLESTDPIKRRFLYPTRSSRYAHAYDYFPGAALPDEREELLHQMTGLFSSMRHQLQHLHSENRAFKKALEDLRVEVEYRGGSFGRFRVPASKHPGDLLMQEETMLRSQLFDDMQGKGNGPKGNNSQTSKREPEAKHEPKGKKEKDNRADLKSPSSSASVFGGPAPSSAGRSAGSEPDVSEELKRAIMNATGGGR